MRSTRLRALGVLTVAGLLGAGVIAAPAADSVKTKVKITEGGPQAFEGKVTSKKAKCVRNRKVTLKYSAGRGKGEDTGVRSTWTDDQGRWRLEGAFVAGFYQAVVQRLVLEAYVCRAARTLEARY